MVCGNRWGRGESEGASTPTPHVSCNATVFSRAASQWTYDWRLNSMKLPRLMAARVPPWMRINVKNLPRTYVRLEITIFSAPLWERSLQLNPWQVFELCLQRRLEVINIDGVWFKGLLTRIEDGWDKILNYFAVCVYGQRGSLFAAAPACSRRIRYYVSFFSLLSEQTFSSFLWINMSHRPAFASESAHFDGRAARETSGRIFERGSI